MGNPRILGVPGGGLNNATWAANADVAKIGQKGEQQTAVLLDIFAGPEHGVTVLHDLRIPIPKFSANIDHVVVSGNTVHIIDTKVWKPAFYWTIGGKSRRGTERFQASEKKTMEMAYDALTRHLAAKGLTSVRFATPVLAIWPSSTKKNLNVRWLKVPGARAMSADAFRSHAQVNFARRGEPANPLIVMALAELLVTKPNRTGSF
jgi:hypothetical protein